VKFARRLDQVPPYLFAELERKISSMEADGIDVISLGIGDPDLPTPELVIEAAARALRDPSTHDYPTNHGTREFREAVAGFYRDRFGVDLNPDGEIVPVLGGKEGVSHVALVCLDPGDLCLAPDPGYPPYTQARCSPAPSRTTCRWRRRTASFPTSTVFRPTSPPAPTCSSSTTRTTRPGRSFARATSPARSRSRASTN
jgi:aspartate/methionine/tyrosine aminotransferase